MQCQGQSYGPLHLLSTLQDKILILVLPAVHSGDSSFAHIFISCPPRIICDHFIDSLDFYDVEYRGEKTTGRRKGQEVPEGSRRRSSLLKHKASWFCLVLGNGARKMMGYEGVARRKKRGLMSMAVVSTWHWYHED